MKSVIKLIKLDFQFIGPFEIVEKKSPIAYKLALPPSLSKIHDIFHVSLLQKYVTRPYHVLDFSKLQMLDPHAIKVILVKILAFRTKKLINREINECLVHWDKYSE